MTAGDPPVIDNREATRSVVVLFLKNVAAHGSVTTRNP
jgi:hypothetical protein